MSIRITIKHIVAHVHAQNSLTKSFIKCLQLITRPLLMKVKLPVSTWRHVILHVVTLIRIRPPNYHKYSPIQLVYNQEPNIFYIRIFGYAIYILIALLQCIKMGPQRRLRIYVRYEFPSIIKYLEPLTGDLFTTQFNYCHFDESFSQH